MDQAVETDVDAAATAGWLPPFAVGQELVSSVAFTPDSVRAFATLALDKNPLHHDEAVAAETRFGGLIASGTQTTSYMLGSLSDHVAAVASLGLDCAFKLVKAVPARCGLTVRWTVTAITPKPSLSGAIVALDGAMQDAGGQVFVRATATILVMPPEALRRRAAASPITT